VTEVTGGRGEKGEETGGVLGEGEDLEKKH